MEPWPWSGMPAPGPTLPGAIADRPGHAGALLLLTERPPGRCRLRDELRVHAAPGDDGEDDHDEQAALTTSAVAASIR